MKTLFKTALLVLALTSISCNSSNKKTKKENRLAVNTPIEKDTKKQFIKIALLLDTSNSMDGLIDQAKAQLWEIVNELSYAKCEHEDPELKIALYEYGNDRLESSDGYIRQVLDFSGDLDEISEKLFSLTTNGGSEHCGEVIQTSLNQLKWGNNKDDLKLIFIAGNEPFTQGKINYKDATTNAIEKDVIVNTIFCGNYNNGINGKWLDGAKLTGGDYLNIDQNREIIHISTPYDDIIIQLNSKLNKTYVSYGSQGYSKMRLQSAQDDNAMELEEVVAVKRAVSKSSKMYKNKSWDLVDAEKEADFRYSKLDKKTLPKELQNKSTEELKVYVKQKSVERVKIQKEIQELNKKRTAYITEKRKASSSEETLDSAMIKAIKKQAKKKNYTWK
ncbi:MAG: VWA domain-containing protein [Flavobacteriaceae bacterium]|nr:VWA domain-containing protein [Flavobacteriaceae bacterium]